MSRPLTMADVGAYYGGIFRSLVDAAEQFALGWHAAVNGVPVRESDLVEPGTAIYTEDAIFVSDRDVIRDRHPKGIEGDIAASLEWQRRRIDQAAAAAVRRIERMHQTEVAAAGVELRPLTAGERAAHLAAWQETAKGGGR